MMRHETKYGYTNTWWRVMFVDNDNTFIGKLERCHWMEYEAHKKGDTDRFNISLIQRVYVEGEQFCYSDNISICNCKGLCYDK